MNGSVQLPQDTLLSHIQALQARLGIDRASAVEDDLPFPLSAADLKCLCGLARQEFLSEPGLLELSAGLVVVGDIHGQFDDLLSIFRQQGFPPQTKYLFLGDYVDRGVDGLEVMALLMAYKLLYPEHIFLLRGNHETSFITLMYGFYAECLRKMTEDAWKDVCEVFDCLPVAARIGSRILCLHGGISPELVSLNDINALQRPSQLDTDNGGLLTDLVWSDPSVELSGWMKNRRGAGWYFGLQALRSFKRKHGLDMIVRAHETIHTGCQSFGDDELFTVFSAPNYQNLGNTGATMTVNEDMSYSFTMYVPSNAKATELKAASVHASAATTSQGDSAEASDCSTSYCTQCQVPVSPFACSQNECRPSNQVTRPMEDACCDGTTGMFADSYVVPLSPFAACGTGPKESAFSAPQDWQSSCSMGSLLSSLKTTLPGSLSQDPGEHSNFKSHLSVAAAVVVSGA